ncbi:MAG: Tetratricopeptide repeat [Chthonomonadales bacterium]|nr:Tetratricopeptide repeat [Chthonomonadales bacterium]
MPIGGVVCLLALSGCSHPAAVRMRPTSPPPPPVASPSAAPQVTQQDLDAALAAVRAAPRSSAAYLRLGDIYMALGLAADGANALRRAAALDPQSEPPLLALARLYKEMGRYEDRESKVLLRLIALHTQNALVYLRLGQIYMGLNWLEPARPLLEKSLKLNPNSTAGQIEMAHYLFLRGNANQAISQLQTLHIKAANDVVVANLLGQYYLAMHNYTAAETALRETLHLQPADRDLEVELAFVLMQQNRPAVLPEAIALLQGVAASGRRQVEAYTWLGRIYENQNRTAEAITSYEKAVQLQPSFENVSMALGRLYLRQGKKQEGERLVHFYQQIKQNSADYALARELLAQHPDDANAHAKVAGWYMRMKEYPNAISEWKKVLELRPGDAPARQQLITALSGTGRVTEAQELHTSAPSTKRRGGKGAE